MSINIKTTILAIGALLISGNCVAEDTLTPQPKSYSVITGDSITLGDVFEGVKDNADFYLAPAPEAGKIRVISLNELTQISNILHLGWEADNSNYRTVIKKSTASIKANDVEASLAKALKNKITKYNFEVEVLDKNISINIPDYNNKNLVVENLTFDPVRMLATASVYSNDNAKDKKQVKAAVFYITKIPVLSTNMRKDDIISADDISYIELRASEIPASMIVNEDNLIGKTPRNTIAAMAPIYVSDLKMPTLVKKGDIVVMKLENMNISLTTQGFATQPGKQGDVVKVENLTSKQIITGVVTGEREITVTAANTKTISKL